MIISIPTSFVYLLNKVNLTTMSISCCEAQLKILIIFQRDSSKHRERQAIRVTIACLENTKKLPVGDGNMEVFLQIEF